MKSFCCFVAIVISTLTISSLSYAYVDSLGYVSVDIPSTNYLTAQLIKGEFGPFRVNEKDCLENNSPFNNFKHQAMIATGNTIENIDEAFVNFGNSRYTSAVLKVTYSNGQKASLVFDCKFIPKREIRRNEMTFEYERK